MIALLRVYACSQWSRVVDVGAALRLVQNIPKVDMKQVDVNRDCEPIGENDFESFGTAFIVGSGMTLSAEAELVLEKGEFVGQDIPDSWDVQLWDIEVPFAPALGINKTLCFVLSDNTTPGNVTVAGQPAPTGTLLAAQSAIPT